ncbi:MAG TPA: colicin E3/pyocin S6 family cytotoxin [Gaiellaceae bacterium]|nr:colicin E3/pyocin S6 family cytotoxin [Gaiellaceae bacterium]
MARPRAPFLDRQECLGFTHGAMRWRSADRKRLYEWDETHGHIEAYNQRGRHVGVLNGEGVVIGDARKGRRIDV